MCSLRSRARRAFLGLLSFGLCAAAFAGFASTESFLPAVGRVAGQGGAEFYTTLWATNLTGAPVHFTFDFLKSGQANPSPATFTDTLAPGETKVYENVVETKLGLNDALGAARVTSDGEILVAERIYNQAPGADLGDTEGLFFAGVPKSFSISAGQSASIQGIDQGGSEDFRYNFALVETGGGSANVNVQVFDGSGSLLGQKSFPLSPYEQIQPGVGDVVANIHTTNARITATVTSGTGSVLLAGAQVANVSQDSSGFEMSFRDDILGGGGAAGVTSLNGLTGAVTLTAGPNVTLTPSGQTIEISAASPGGGGLTLPYAQTASTSGALFTITNANGEGGGVDVTVGGESGEFSHPTNAAVYGDSNNGYGVIGETSGPSFVSGVLGTSSGPVATGVYAEHTGNGIALQAVARGSGYGVAASSVNGVAISAESPVDAIEGTSGGGGFSAGVFGGNTSTGVGVYGRTSASSAYAVYGNSNGQGFAGYFDGDVHVQGMLSKAGGSFKIDDPVDPAHKYLSHSFVESPDMKNIYDGVATLDAEGRAVVALPSWFGALNRDFRYQLTAIGMPQPTLFVADEVHENSFRIAGGVPGARVSWQVTGIRQDAWANAHRIPVEEVKPPLEQGTYTEPALFGQPEERSLRAAKQRAAAPKTADKDGVD